MQLASWSDENIGLSAGDRAALPLIEIPNRQPHIACNTLFLFFAVGSSNFSSSFTRKSFARQMALNAHFVGVMDVICLNGDIHLHLCKHRIEIQKSLLMTEK